MRHSQINFFKFPQSHRVDSFSGQLRDITWSLRKVERDLSKLCDYGNYPTWRPSQMASFEGGIDVKRTGKIMDSYRYIVTLSAILCYQCLLCYFVIYFERFIFVIIFFVINQQKLQQKHRFILKETRDGRSIICPRSVINFYLGPYFPT